MRYNNLVSKYLNSNFGKFPGRLPDLSFWRGWGRLIQLWSWWRRQQYFTQNKTRNKQKAWISNSVCTTRFWNNLHQVRSKSKCWKAKSITV